MYFIGVMSGTSCDGIDVALVDFSAGIQTVATAFQKYPEDVRNQLQLIIRQQPVTVAQLSQLDAKLGHLYAQVVKLFLQKQNLTKSDIQAIGLHGQTVYHDPNDQYANTWQIGSAALVAQQTGITTVANFRQMDVAYGGQGAPLAPLFHHHVFANFKGPVGVLNLGGIANITVIDGDDVIGFDTGPANCLLDDWIHHHQSRDYDADGLWAQQGKVNDDLLKRLLEAHYFKLPHPKSTGRELFNMEWLMKHKEVKDISAVDVQRTLLQLTVDSVSNAILQTQKNFSRLVVCGGGSHNQFLLQQLSNKLAVKVETSAEYGIDPDYMEAILMAWMAKQNLLENQLDFLKITGCEKPHVYGVRYSM